MAANRILIICCIVGIVLGYAVGTFVDSVNLNTALTIGLIGGLAVGYLLDKSGAQTGSGTAKTAAPSGSAISISLFCGSSLTIPEVFISFMAS